MRNPLRVIAVGLLCAVAGGAAAMAETMAERCAARAALGDHLICAQAVAAAPDDPALRRLYAISLSKAADYDGAIEQFREVTRLAPADGHAFYDYAWMLAFVRRYAEAVAPIERAIRLMPQDTDSYRAAAIIYFVAKRPRDVFRVALAGAKLGDPIAMFDTFDCYAAGRGVARNDAEAFRWLLRAADAGHVTAMDRVAEIYLNGGFGQAPDGGAAEKWAAKARIARNGRL